MGRFLLGLLCAGVLFWSYDHWFAGQASAGAGLPGAVPRSGEVVDFGVFKEGVLEEGGLAKIVGAAGSGPVDPGDRDLQEPVAADDDLERLAPRPLVAAASVGLADYSSLTLEQFVALVEGGDERA